ncbi:hypothetical protein Tco_0487309 [Tanacetum coccineum]
MDATLEFPMSRDVGYGIKDFWDDMVGEMDERAPTTLDDLSQRVTDLSTTLAWDTHEIHYARIGSLETLVATLVAQTSSLLTQLTTALRHIQTLEAREPKMPPKRTATTTTSMTDAQIKALISQGVVDALEEIKANRTSRNGDDSHDSRSGGRRQVSTIYEYTYTDFLKCQPLNFNGTEGVVGLTQWFEKIESVFHISNCTNL